jgi:hypothetical protein
VLPEATVPKQMIATIHVSDFAIVLEDTELQAVREHLGGQIGSQGDAGEALGWLCLHGTDAMGGWVLWLKSGEIDGPNVSGFQWQRVTSSAQFDARCQALPEGSSNVALPIELRLGTTEAQVLEILGPPSARTGNNLIYVHEHEQSIHDQPYTSVNSVIVVLRNGIVWGIEVEKTTTS